MKFKTIHYGKGLIEYNLTISEMLEYLFACIKSIFSGKSIAYYLSEDLETLLCFDHPRQKIIKPMTNSEIHKIWSDEK